MITATYTIHFDFQVATAKLNIPLEANVQEHHSAIFYKVTNFHIPGNSGDPVLPEISIRKEGDLWVHTDSGFASDLSIAVGKAIDTRSQQDG